MKKIKIDNKLKSRLDETKLRIQREARAMDILKENFVLDDFIEAELLDEVVTSMLDYKYKQ